MEEDKKNNAEDQLDEQEVVAAAKSAEETVTEPAQLSEVEVAQAEAKKNLDGWQRSQAEFENYKKREEAKQKDILEFAKEVTIVKMLPTLDSLEQGLKAIPDTTIEGFAEKFETWKTGVAGILQQLTKAMNELGVERFKSVGEQFDPNRHEAVREVPGEEDGVVMEELQSGYRVNDKIVRPSQVVVSKKS